MSLFPTALPHTVSQVLQANHDRKQPGGRHDDSPVACPVQRLFLRVCLEPASIHRLSESLCASRLRPNICVTRAHIFFLPQGFQKITWGLLALSLTLSAQHGDRLQAWREKIGECSRMLCCCCCVWLVWPPSLVAASRRLAVGVTLPREKACRRARPSLSLPSSSCMEEPAQVAGNVGLRASYRPALAPPSSAISACLRKVLQ